MIEFGKLVERFVSAFNTFSEKMKEVPVNLTTKDLCNAMVEFGKVVERFVSAFACACNAFIDTFSEKMKEAVENDAPR